MNPIAIMKIKPMLEKFHNNHPKVPLFFAAASQAVDEGSVIEIKVTTSEGKELITNMRVSADDLELVKELRELIGK